MATPEHLRRRLSDSRDLKLDVLDELWANATASEAKASELHERLLGRRCSR
jgi:hypothetical protein